MNTLTLDLPVALDEQLTEAAQARGVSKVEIIYEAIKEYLAKRRVAPPDSSLSTDVIGCVDGSPPYL